VLTVEGEARLVSIGERLCADGKVTGKAANRVDVIL
jgi:hypothetical protein